MEKKELKQYLEEGKTFREIAKLVGKSHQTVDYYVGKYDLRNYVLNQKPSIYKFTKIDTKEKAYIIGFIAGDAAFTETKLLDLAVASEDREILEFIASILKCEIKDNSKYDVKKRIFPNSRISCSIPDIFTFIGDRLKINRNLPIVSKKLDPYLVQGFFDAEGCITWGFRKDRGRLWQKVSFTSSEKLLVTLQKILLNYGISTAVKPKSGENCSVIEFSNELDVFTFLKFLPKDGYFLKRKRENYLEWLKEVNSKYSFNKGDIVKFADKRTLDKYGIDCAKLRKGEFLVIATEESYCELENGMKVNKLLLTKKGISNYALRLELEEFGGTTL